MIAFYSYYPKVSSFFFLVLFLKILFLFSSTVLVELFNTSLSDISLHRFLCFLDLPRPTCVYLHPFFFFLLKVVCKYDLGIDLKKGINVTQKRK